MTDPSTAASKHPMPAAFLGHGSPMNALETNRYTRAWRAFGASVPRPGGILVVHGVDWAHRFAEVLVDGHAFGALSMTCYQLDAPAPGVGAKAGAGAGAAASLPDPSVIPPEDTNL